MSRFVLLLRNVLLLTHCSGMPNAFSERDWPVPVRYHGEQPDPANVENGTGELLVKGDAPTPRCSRDP